MIFIILFVLLCCFGWLFRFSAVLLFYLYSLFCMLFGSYAFEIDLRCWGLLYIRRFVCLRSCFGMIVCSFVCLRLCFRDMVFCGLFWLFWAVLSCVGLFGLCCWEVCKPVLGRGVLRFRSLRYRNPRS